MIDESGFTWAHGGVIRGKRDEKVLSLVFTGGDFGEGTGAVLDALEKHRVPGSFYFTGDYLAKPEHGPHLERMLASGHVIGPHGHAHLLYCPWEDREKTLVTREEFASDLRRNVETLSRLGVNCESMLWWIPPYEWYNAEIARWSEEVGHRVFNFTPGTLSHADYTEDEAKNYRSNQVIWDSIFAYEAGQPDGLNGFMLLTHVGAGPRRTEKFFDRLDEMITKLRDLGYSFSSIPVLLSGAPPAKVAL
jgi:peptidoglycan/xylan/chitin deacetylase (PgdA/CDA1 family)